MLSSYPFSSCLLSACAALIESAYPAQAAHASRAAQLAGLQGAQPQRSRAHKADAQGKRYVILPGPSASGLNVGLRCHHTHSCFAARRPVTASSAVPRANRSWGITSPVARRIPIVRVGPSRAPPLWLQRRLAKFCLRTRQTRCHRRSLAGYIAND